VAWHHGPPAGTAGAGGAEPPDEFAEATAPSPGDAAGAAGAARAGAEGAALLDAERAGALGERVLAAACAGGGGFLDAAQEPRLPLPPSY
jgi:hypothetical protein